MTAYFDGVEHEVVWAGEDLGASFEYRDIREDLKAEAMEYREQLVETLVELDEDAMTAYFDGVEPDEAKMKELIRSGTLGGSFVPMLCGSAFKNKGVQNLLDAVCDFLPAPTDLPPLIGTDVKDPEVELVRKPEDSEPFSGLAFKVMTDPFVGTLTFVRVYSG